MHKPNFFLIGAPKCGTTAMAHYLAEHPQVCFSYPKEPYYWADDFPGLQRQYGIRSLYKYLKLFDQPADEVVATGEGSTIYLASSTAVERIHGFAPEAKFVVMLRQPVELAASLHQQELSHLNEDQESFQTAWELQGDRIAGKHIPKDCYEPAMLNYRRIASLGQQVERLLGTVSRDRVHIIFFDDFRTSALESYRQTVEFLGLSYDGRETFPRINEGQRPRVKWLTKMLNGRRGTIVSRFLKRTLKGPLRTFADRAKKVLTTRKQTRLPLEPQFQEHVLEEFAEDIRLLSDVTGRDLSDWLGARK